MQDTGWGSRTVRAWLRQPLVHMEPLQLRQNAVATLVDDNIGRDRFRDEGLAGLSGLDLDKLAVQLFSFQDGAVGSTSSALECMYQLYIC